MGCVHLEKAECKGQTIENGLHTYYRLKHIP